MLYIFSEQKCMWKILIPYISLQLVIKLERLNVKADMDVTNTTIVHCYENYLILCVRMKEVHTIIGRGNYGYMKLWLI